MADGSQPMHRMHRFSPGPDTQRQFRDALGQFGTGVTIVTAMTAAGPIGMTANSFSSVSMDPALVLWCPAKSSGRYKHFAEAKHFAIHVMGSDHESLALAFAQSGKAFGGLQVEISEQGVPLLNECLARFECDMHALHDAGDHVIAVGLVTRAAIRTGQALIFCQGDFGKFEKGA
jgi:flavin reductase (DIM6/NTAB) family NADH-FMN oxidoreductase RutF